MNFLKVALKVFSRGFVLNFENRIDIKPISQILTFLEIYNIRPLKNK